MSTRPISPRRRLALLAVVVAVVGAGLLSVPWEWLESAEYLTVDLRYQARGLAHRAPDSVIVGVADSSFSIAARAPADAAREPLLAAMAAPWPWDRQIFAQLVRRLRASGARLIVFDIVLAAETAGDADFARALAEPGAPVVLPSDWQVAHSALGEATVTLVEPCALFLAANDERIGYANVWPDGDGVLRQLTTTMHPGDLLGAEPSAQDTLLPSLAYAAAQTLRPTTPATPGYIDYRWLAGVIPTLPIEDIFLPDRWTGRQLQSGALFRDRIVWVGPLSEIRFKDYHATPLGRMAGVETQAQALETFLGAGPLQPLRPAAALACVWALALGGALATALCRRVSWQLALTTAGALAWIGFSLACFSLTDRVLPVVAPLAAWLIATAGGVGARVITEQRERRRIRGVLGRYVSEEVAKIVADRPDDFNQALRGERRVVTVLFADLRGFTSWVETVAPDVLVAQLNEYFKVVVDGVLGQGGTLQKFIGDAVLAVWGDTRSAGAQADATRAVDAALAIHAAVAQLNSSWAGRSDRTPLRIGIGLHHGSAMVGNLGHPQRMEFTVLGDAVNVAARLESANRQLGTDILVSAAVRNQLAASHRFAPLGHTILKGKREAVALFAPLGLLAEPAPAWLQGAEAVDAAWTAGEFARTVILLEQLTAQSSPLAEFFASRLVLARQFAASPPADWAGTLQLESK